MLREPLREPLKNSSFQRKCGKIKNLHEVSRKEPNAGRSSASNASKKARIASRTSGQDFAGLDALPGMAPDAKSGPLGNNAKSVRRLVEETGENRDPRADRFRWQRHASKLLGGRSRIGLCRWSMVSRGAGVSVVVQQRISDPKATHRAHFRGLQTCGSVWACPCCSPRISEERKNELNDLLAWARGERFVVQMVTLTARHGRKDQLPDLLDSLKRAKQALARHRAYGRLKLHIKGHVTATEITHGANGWHPHYHILFITKESVDLEVLREPWLASLRGVGLSGGGAAFHVQDASAAGNYIAKFGAAEEIALHGHKKGRSGSRTPQQLLTASCDESDVRSGMLWIEYANAFHGRRQLVWSRGLKAEVGIGDVSDEEAAEDQSQEEQVEIGSLTIRAEAWQPTDKCRRGVQYFRFEVLKAAEVGGFDAVSEVVTDAISGSDVKHKTREVGEFPEASDKGKPD